MPTSQTNVLGAIGAALALQEAELAETRARQVVAVVSKYATGTGDINETFSLSHRFRLVFVRCHFNGGTGVGALTIDLDSVSGTAYDTRLFTISQAGTSGDVHLRIGDGATGEPSAWAFQSGDAVGVGWTNPDSGNMTWGLEIGLALAS